MAKASIILILAILLTIGLVRYTKKSSNEAPDLFPDPEKSPEEEEIQTNLDSDEVKLSPEIEKEIPIEEEKTQISKVSTPKKSTTDKKPPAKKSSTAKKSPARKVTSKKSAE